MRKHVRKAAAGLAIASAVALVGGSAAFADATKTGGQYRCSFNIETISIQSNASGQVFHLVAGHIVKRWDNKNSYTWRSNRTGYGAISAWGVISTGGIRSAAPNCAV
ncbi:hypothetical protein LK09_18955 [Microbacterium mangrovi]|uniref:Uncharacterized protein n=1 Tax=Microbacterium mangrovi TaxID=1348253 RepID=A0A0B1ZXJ6_9MICO|nr:hypothetical protein [Microbacterium mangrovi]KHK95474.1 hypothetical protein LK09_18955 [Microbacterium mangrovi]